MSQFRGILDDRRADWRQRLAAVVEMMREVSRHTDPQAMVRAYASCVQELMPSDAFLAVSRRGLPVPKYRITRSSRWTEEINPWKEAERLPVLEGGLLGELLYGNEPRIIDDLRVAPDDPAREFLADQRSLIAMPLYDDGVAMNMVVRLRREPGAFDAEGFPDNVWMANLFGRATHNLVLSEQLREAYDALDQELRVVADLQRSLLPAELPRIPTMDLAVHYQTSRRVGGDYYDFFPLPDGRWGILIADVSGHGAPAAVMMAVTHAIAHTHPGPPLPPGRVLAFVNEQLVARYTNGNGTFVTAFYGIYDPRSREFRYACAGHNPPRLKRCEDGTMASLDGVLNLPLGVQAGEAYEEATHRLRPGDQIIFYTDGITEARNPAGEMFGTQRLDEVLEACLPVASTLIRAVLDAVEQFSEGRPADDDRTVLIAKIR